MPKSQFDRNLVFISALVLTVQFIAAPAFGDTSTAAYKEQMRAYHAKLLTYQVQPGRLQALRKEICERLKGCTRGNQNVDALWAKFDALERRVKGTDNAYAADLNALSTELKNKEAEFKTTSSEPLLIGRNDSNSKNSSGAPANQSANQGGSDAAIADFFRNCAPRSGLQFNRRKRIFEELKRCHQQKKNIANHVQQYLKMDNALLSGSSSLNDLCTQLEDSLALPHNIKD